MRNYELVWYIEPAHKIIEVTRHSKEEAERLLEKTSNSFKLDMCNFNCEMRMVKENVIAFKGPIPGRCVPEGQIQMRHLWGISR